MQTECPDCRAPLKVLKTRKRSVVTMPAGAFGAHETLLHCTQCENETVYTSEVLTGVVPDHWTFGYDVLVYVGKALFLGHRNSREICDELAARNIRISPREIGYLGNKFIIYLAIAHRQSAPKIHETMQAKGGYVLHLDGTCEGASPHLMSGLDSISDLVLGNVKLPSENADEIIPFLHQIQSLFGEPLAAVHDMGRGILKAVAEVFPLAPDFICHFHFLRDLGNDLLEADDAVIRKRLKKHKIAAKLRRRTRALKKIMDDHPELVDALHTGLENDQLPDSARALAPVVCAYSILHWVLHGKNQGQGYGFPFDRPRVQFARRLHALHENLEHLKSISLRGQWRDNLPFCSLLADLKDVVSDTVLRKTMTEIQTKIEVFDKLRDAMRIAPKDGKQGLNSDGMDANIKTIEKRVTDFRHWLSNHRTFAQRKEYKEMIAQIDKYWDKLFADPIVVQTPTGIVTIQPQRTNNILERLFRDHKQGNRRRTGNSRMAKTLQTMLADTPLVKNLEHPQYLKILLDGKANLEELFADIDRKLVRTELDKAQETPDKLPAKIRKIIAKPMLPELITNMFHNTPHCAAAS